jgi:hypothetical protein
MTAGPVSLTLELAGGATDFEPGATVSGWAAWSVPVPTAGMELRLIWATLGPGGRDFGIAQTIPFQRPLAEERRPFVVTLPTAPYSFRGRLIALVWTLELVALPGEEKTLVELTVAPERRRIELGHDGVAP